MPEMKFCHLRSEIISELKNTPGLARLNIIFPGSEQKQVSNYGNSCRLFCSVFVSGTRKV